MATKLALLAISALLGACAAAPEPSADGEDHRRTVVSLPLDIGKLKIHTLYEYPDPRLGSVYDYAGDFALQPDVYVYPNPFIGTAPPEGVRAASPDWAAALFEDEIAYAVEQGAYESAEVTGITDVAQDWKYGTLAGKCVILTTVRHGHELYSRAYFFAVWDQLVKVRISHFDYPGLGDNMDWFVDHLVAGMRVVILDQDGAVIDVDRDGDVEQQFMSQMDDIVVVQTRNEIMQKAVSGTEDGRIHYGEFERREPITGPAEAETLLDR